MNRVEFSLFLKLLHISACFDKALLHAFLKGCRGKRCSCYRINIDALILQDFSSDFIKSDFSNTDCFQIFGCINRSDPVRINGYLNRQRSVVSINFCCVGSGLQCRGRSRSESRKQNDRIQSEKTHDSFSLENVLLFCIDDEVHPSLGL